MLQPSACQDAAEIVRSRINAGKQHCLVLVAVMLVTYGPPCMLIVHWNYQKLMYM